MDDTTPFEALQAAVAAAGSQAALARICDVTPTAVWKWVQSSKRIPAEYVLSVEARTGVSRHTLRPDIYPRELMADHRAGCRFEAVDHDVIARPHFGANPNAQGEHVDFKRGDQVKAAAR